VKFYFGDCYENLRRKPRFASNQTAISGTVDEDPSKFMLFGTVRTILLRDISTKGTHFCLSKATLEGCILLSVTCWSYEGNALLLLHGSSGYANAP
jgi:hypothetical protein